MEDLPEQNLTKGLKPNGQTDPLGNVRSSHNNESHQRATKSKNDEKNEIQATTCDYEILDELIKRINGSEQFGLSDESMPKLPQNSSIEELNSFEKQKLFEKADDLLETTVKSFFKEKKETEDPSIRRFLNSDTIEPDDESHDIIVKAQAIVEEQKEITEMDETAAKLFQKADILLQDQVNLLCQDGQSKNTKTNDDNAATNVPITNKNFTYATVTNATVFKTTTTLNSSSSTTASISANVTKRLTKHTKKEEKRIGRDIKYYELYKIPKKHSKNFFRRPRRKREEPKSTKVWESFNWKIPRRKKGTTAAVEEQVTKSLKAITEEWNKNNKGTTSMKMEDDVDNKFFEGLSVLERMKHNESECELCDLEKTSTESSSSDEISLDFRPENIMSASFSSEQTGQGTTAKIRTKLILPERTTASLIETVTLPAIKSLGATERLKQNKNKIFTQTTPLEESFRAKKNMSSKTSDTLESSESALYTRIMIKNKEYDDDENVITIKEESIIQTISKKEKEDEKITENKLEYEETEKGKTKIPKTIMDTTQELNLIKQAEEQAMLPKSDDLIEQEKQQNNVFSNSSDATLQTEMTVLNSESKIFGVLTGFYKTKTQSIAEFLTESSTRVFLSTPIDVTLPEMKDHIKTQQTETTELEKIENVPNTKTSFKMDNKEIFQEKSLTHLFISTSVDVTVPELEKEIESETKISEAIEPTLKETSKEYTTFKEIDMLTPITTTSSLEITSETQKSKVIKSTLIKSIESAGETSSPVSTEYEPSIKIEMITPFTATNSSQSESEMQNLEELESTSMETTIPEKSFTVAKYTDFDTSKKIEMISQINITSSVSTKFDITESFDETKTTIMRKLDKQNESEIDNSKNLKSTSIKIIEKYFSDEVPTYYETYTMSLSGNQSELPDLEVTEPTLLPVTFKYSLKPKVSENHFNMTSLKSKEFDITGRFEETETQFEESSEKEYLTYVFSLTPVVITVPEPKEDETETQKSQLIKPTVMETKESENFFAKIFTPSEISEEMEITPIKTMMSSEIEPETEKSLLGESTLIKTTDVEIKYFSDISEKYETSAAKEIIMPFKTKSLLKVETETEKATTESTNQFFVETETQKSQLIKPTVMETKESEFFFAKVFTPSEISEEMEIITPIKTMRSSEIEPETEKSLPGESILIETTEVKIKYFSDISETYETSEAKEIIMPFKTKSLLKVETETEEAITESTNQLFSDVSTVYKTSTEMGTIPSIKTTSSSQFKSETQKSEVIEPTSIKTTEFEEYFSLEELTEMETITPKTKSSSQLESEPQKPEVIEPTLRKATKSQKEVSFKVSEGYETSIEMKIIRPINTMSSPHIKSEPQKSEVTQELQVIEPTPIRTKELEIITPIKTTVSLQISTEMQKSEATESTTKLEKYSSSEVTAGYEASLKMQPIPLMKTTSLSKIKPEVTKPILIETKESEKYSSLVVTTWSKPLLEIITQNKTTSSSQTELETQESKVIEPTSIKTTEEAEVSNRYETLTEISSSSQTKFEKQELEVTEPTSELITGHETAIEVEFIKPMETLGSSQIEPEIQASEPTFLIKTKYEKYISEEFSTEYENSTDIKIMTPNKTTSSLQIQSEKQEFELTESTLINIPESEQYFSGIWYENATEKERITPSKTRSSLYIESEIQDTEETELTLIRATESERYISEGVFTRPQTSEKMTIEFIDQTSIKIVVPENYFSNKNTTVLAKEATKNLDVVYEYSPEIEATNLTTKGASAPEGQFITTVKEINVISEPNEYREETATERTNITIPTTKKTEHLFRPISTKEAKSMFNLLPTQKSLVFPKDLETESASVQVFELTVTTTEVESSIESTIPKPGGSPLEAFSYSQELEPWTMSFQDSQSKFIKTKPITKQLLNLTKQQSFISSSFWEEETTFGLFEKPTIFTLKEKFKPSATKEKELSTEIFQEYFTSLPGEDNETRGAKYIKVFYLKDDQKFLCDWCGNQTTSQEFSTENTAKEEDTSASEILLYSSKAKEQKEGKNTKSVKDNTALQEKEISELNFDIFTSEQRETETETTKQIKEPIIKQEMQTTMFLLNKGNKESIKRKHSEKHSQTTIFKKLESSVFEMEKVLKTKEEGQNYSTQKIPKDLTAITEAFKQEPKKTMIISSMGPHKFRFVTHFAPVEHIHVNKDLFTLTENFSFNLPGKKAESTERIHEHIKIVDVTLHKDQKTATIETEKETSPKTKFTTSFEFSKYNYSLEPFKFNNFTPQQAIMVSKLQEQEKQSSVNNEHKYSVHQQQFYLPLEEPSETEFIDFTNKVKAGTPCDSCTDKPKHTVSDKYKKKDQMDVERLVTHKQETILGHQEHNLSKQLTSQTEKTEDEEIIKSLSFEPENITEIKETDEIFTEKSQAIIENYSGVSQPEDKRIESSKHEKLDKETTISEIVEDSKLTIAEEIQQEIFTEQTEIFTEETELKVENEEVKQEVSTQREKKQSEKSEAITAGTKIETTLRGVVGNSKIQTELAIVETSLKTEVEITETNNSTKLESNAQETAIITLEKKVQEHLTDENETSTEKTELEEKHKMSEEKTKTILTQVSNQLKIETVTVESHSATKISIEDVKSSTGYVIKEQETAIKEIVKNFKQTSLEVKDQKLFTEETETLARETEFEIEEQTEVTKSISTKYETAHTKTTRTGTTPRDAQESKELQTEFATVETFFQTEVKITEVKGSTKFESKQQEIEENEQDQFTKKSGKSTGETELGEEYEEKRKEIFTKQTEIFTEETELKVENEEVKQEVSTQREKKQSEKSEAITAETKIETTLRGVLGNSKMQTELAIVETTLKTEVEITETNDSRKLESNAQETAIIALENKVQEHLTDENETSTEKAELEERHEMTEEKSKTILTQLSNQLKIETVKVESISATKNNIEDVKSSTGYVIKEQETPIKEIVKNFEQTSLEVKDQKLFTEETETLAKETKFEIEEQTEVTKDISTEYKTADTKTARTGTTPRDAQKSTKLQTDFATVETFFQTEVEITEVKGSTKFKAKQQEIEENEQDEFTKKSEKSTGEAELGEEYEEKRKEVVTQHEENKSEMVKVTKTTPSEAEESREVQIETSTVESLEAKSKVAGVKGSTKPTIEKQKTKLMTPEEKEQDLFIEEAKTFTKKPEVKVEEPEYIKQEVSTEHEQNESKMFKESKTAETIKVQIKSSSRDTKGSTKLQTEFPTVETSLESEFETTELKVSTKFETEEQETTNISFERKEEEHLSEKSNTSTKETEIKLEEKQDIKQDVSTEHTKKQSKILEEKIEETSKTEMKSTLGDAKMQTELVTEGSSRETEVKTTELKVSTKFKTEQESSVITVKKKEQEYFTEKSETFTEKKDLELEEQKGKHVETSETLVKKIKTTPPEAKSNTKSIAEQEVNIEDILQTSELTLNESEQELLSEKTETFTKKADQDASTEHEKKRSKMVKVKTAETIRATTKKAVKEAEGSTKLTNDEFITVEIPLETEVKITEVRSNPKLKTKEQETTVNMLGKKEQEHFAKGSETSTGKTETSQSKDKTSENFTKKSAETGLKDQEIEKENQGTVLNDEGAEEDLTLYGNELEDNEESYKEDNEEAQEKYKPFTDEKTTTSSIVTTVENASARDQQILTEISVFKEEFEMAKITEEISAQNASEENKIFEIANNFYKKSKVLTTVFTHGGIERVRSNISTEQEESVTEEDKLKSTLKPLVIIVNNSQKKIKKINNTLLEKLLNKSVTDVDLEYIELHNISDTTTQGNRSDLFIGIPVDKCEEKDFEENNNCLCNIQQYLHTISEKIKNRDNISSKTLYCYKFIRPKEGLLIQSKSKTLTRKKRSLLYLKNLGSQHEVVEHDSLEDLFHDDYKLDVSDKNIFALPGTMLEIPCKGNADKFLASANENIWKWQSFDTGKEEYLSQRGNVLTLHHITTNSSGNYTCFKEEDRDNPDKIHAHELEVITFPIYEIQMNIFYRINSSCELSDADILYSYLPKIVGPLLCSNDESVCSVIVERPRCVNREDDTFYNISVLAKVNPDTSFFNTLDNEQCDINCKLKVYNNLVTLVNRNAAAIEHIPVHSSLPSSITSDFIPFFSTKIKSPVDTKLPKIYVSCPGGFGLESKHQTVCVVCPKHTFSDDDEAFCKICPAGQYQPRSGSKMCIQCNSPVDDAMCLRMLYSDTKLFKIYVGMAFGILILLLIGFALWTSSGRDQPDTMRSGYFEGSLRHRAMRTRKPNRSDRDVESGVRRPLLGSSRRRGTPPDLPPVDF